MQSPTLVARIKAETGLTVSNSTDQHLLTGLLNRYRPDGVGLERILPDQGIEGAVRTRIKKVFEVAAPSWNAGDLYFVISRFDALDQESTESIAKIHLNGIKKLADFIGDVEVSGVISKLKLMRYPPAGAVQRSDVSDMMYECLTDFLAKLQPDRHELFMLKEALYFMANDYFLMAYMLWPAVQLSEDVGDSLDSYFDIWCHGIKLDYFANWIVTAKPGRQA